MTKSDWCFHTFAAFGKANNICNAEGQTNSYNKEIICLKLYQRKYSKHNPCNSLPKNEKQQLVNLKQLKNFNYMCTYTHACMYPDLPGYRYMKPERDLATQTLKYFFSYEYYPYHHQLPSGSIQMIIKHFSYTTLVISTSSCI